MIFRYLYYILIILFLSCEQDDLIFNNPLDEENNPDFVEPETLILNNLNNSIVTESSFTISWEGNDAVVEYSYNLNNEGWSEWSNNTSLLVSYLDEGSHSFKVKSRYINEIEDLTPAEAIFDVNAVDGPGLRIFPLYKTISFGTDMVSLYLEEVSNVSFGNIIIDIVPNGCSAISITSIDEGELITGDSIFIYDKDTDQHTINFGITGGGGISGTGEIAKIHLNNSNDSNFTCDYEVQLIIDVQNSELRDYQNNEIIILDSADGVIDDD